MNKKQYNAYMLDSFKKATHTLDERMLYINYVDYMNKKQKESETKIMTKTKTKAKSSRRAVQKKAITTLLFNVEKQNLITETTFNKKRVVYSLSKVYNMLFNVDSKKESKSNFNINFLRVLECDRKAKDNNKCKNTCYDRYYKLLDFLHNDVMNKQQKAKYRNKLASFNKRN